MEVYSDMDKLLNVLLSPFQQVEDPGVLGLDL